MSIQYMSCKYYCIDGTIIIVPKKVNKHVCQCYSMPLLLLIILNITFSRISLKTSYSKLSQRGARMTEWDYCPPLLPVYTPVEYV